MIDAEFPLEDFADEIRACVRVLRRFDLDAQDMGTMVKCPTIHEDEAECGYRLYYADVHEDVTCRRCGATRSAMTLAAVAAADGFQKAHFLLLRSYGHLVLHKDFEVLNQNKHGIYNYKSLMSLII